jgi:hypothetical protein
MRILAASKRTGIVALGNAEMAKIVIPLLAVDLAVTTGSAAVFTECNIISPSSLVQLVFVVLVHTFHSKVKSTSPYCCALVISVELSV